MRHVYGFVVSAWIIWQTLCQVTHKHNEVLSQILEKYFSQIYSLRNEFSIARRNLNTVSFSESRSPDRSLREIKHAKGRTNRIRYIGFVFCLIPEYISAFNEKFIEKRRKYKRRVFRWMKFCVWILANRNWPAKNRYMWSVGTVSVKVTSTVLGSFARTIRSPLKYL